jgi:predicted protein tyrosine phosphatase
MIPKVVARSLPEAHQSLIRDGSRLAVVSIGEPGSDPPMGFQPMNPLHLRLEFHDVWEPVVADANIVLPAMEHIEALLERAPILRTAPTVYCHCMAGISRSTAVAFILRCLWMGPGKEVEALDAVVEDRPIASPNPVLVRLGDRALERDGAMVAALERLSQT